MPAPVGGAAAGTDGAGAAAGASGAGPIPSSFLGAVALGSPTLNDTASTAPAAAPDDVPFASQVSDAEAAALCAAVDAAEAAVDDAFMVAALDEWEERPGAIFTATRRAVARRPDSFHWLPGARKHASTAQRLRVPTEAAACRATLGRLSARLLPAGLPPGCTPYEALYSAAVDDGRRRAGLAGSGAAGTQAVWHSLDVLAQEEARGPATRALGDVHCLYVFSEPVSADSDVSGDGGALRIAGGNFDEGVRAVATGAFTSSAGRVYQVHPCVVTGACKKAPAPSETQAAVRDNKHSVVGSHGVPVIPWHDLHRGASGASDRTSLRAVQMVRDESGPSGLLASRLLQNVATQLHVSVRACVCACVRACVRVCVYVCVCVCARARVIHMDAQRACVRARERVCMRVGA